MKIAGDNSNNALSLSFSGESPAGFLILPSLQRTRIKNSSRSSRFSAARSALGVGFLSLRYCLTLKIETIPDLV
jgi:hypothetical protein